jgi:hypothetical protein
VPGFIFNMVGRSFTLREGSRYSVSTVAWLKSVWKMSPVDELHLARQAFLGRIALRQCHHVRVVLDAKGLGAALGCRDDRSAVPAAQVVEDVLRGQLRHVEHALDKSLWCRHPHDILAALAYVRGEFLGGFLGSLGGVSGRRRKSRREGEEGAEEQGLQPGMLHLIS